MIEMVRTKKQSVTFCKYTIAGLLWASIILNSTSLVYLVLFILLISALTGIQKAPLVTLFNHTVAKRISTEDIYINKYSMRFAHYFGAGFCVLILASHYLFPPIITLFLTIILAILQTIASFGYCSAQKLYECVVCNSNCCRVGKKVRSMNKHVG
jgi:hypothetical protein